MEGGAHRQSHGKKPGGQNKRMVGMAGDLAGKGPVGGGPGMLSGESTPLIPCGVHASPLPQGDPLS